LISRIDDSSTGLSFSRLPNSVPVTDNRKKPAAAKFKTLPKTSEVNFNQIAANTKGAGDSVIQASINKSFMSNASASDSNPLEASGSIPVIFESKNQSKVCVYGRSQSQGLVDIFSTLPNSVHDISSHLPTQAKEGRQTVNTVNPVTRSVWSSLKTQKKVPTAPVISLPSNELLQLEQSTNARPHLITDISDTKRKQQPQSVASLPEFTCTFIVSLSSLTRATIDMRSISIENRGA